MAIEWATSPSLDLLLELDQAEGRRVAIQNSLRAAIRDGRLAPGTRLPASRVLAADLGVARGTISEAYDELVAEGWLTARRGSGTAVAWTPATATRAASDGTGDTAEIAPRFD